MSQNKKLHKEVHTTQRNKLHALQHTEAFASEIAKKDIAKRTRASKVSKTPEWAYVVERIKGIKPTHALLIKISDTTLKTHFKNRPSAAMQMFRVAASKAKYVFRAQGPRAFAIYVR